MKATFALTLCLLLLLFSACSQKLNDPADVQAIKKSVEDFAKTVNAADAAGIAALMTEKAVFADLNVPVVVGKGAIQALWQAWFDQFKTEFSVPVEDVRVTGDSAVARGTWTLKGVPKAQGLAPLVDSGSWIVIFARQADGSWKWNSTVANSNQPLPGSTASGADERALYQLERDWAEANAKKDAAVLDRILANEFQANYAGFFVGNKKQFLADLKSGKTKIESMINSEMRALVFGDTAIVHGLATVKSSTMGKSTSSQGRYTDVFVKREGRWQCVTGYAAKAE
jgi:uncharacterized protein (TIGR02246 family)